MQVSAILEDVQQVLTRKSRKRLGKAQYACQMMGQLVNK